MAMIVCLRFCILGIPQSIVLVYLLFRRGPCIDRNINTKVYHLLHSCSPTLIQFLQILWRGTSVGVYVDSPFNHLKCIFAQFNPLDFAVLRNTELIIAEIGTYRTDTELNVWELCYHKFGNIASISTLRIPSRPRQFLYLGFCSKIHIEAGAMFSHPSTALWPLEVIQEIHHLPIFLIFLRLGV